MRVGGKWAWVAGGLALALGACFHPWPIDPERVARALNASEPAGSDARWRVPVDATLTLAPWPMLRVTGAELATPAGVSLLAAPRVEFGLRAFHLLLGEFSAATATLANPTIQIDLDAMSLETLRRSPVGLVIAHGGTARLVSAARAIDTTIAIEDGRFDWPEPTRPLAIHLRASWRGRTVTAEGAIDAPMSLSRGEPSGAHLAIASASADFFFAGTWDHRAGNQFEGDLVTRVRSRDEIRNWLGVDTPPLMAAQQFALRGKVSGNGDQFELGEAQMEMGAQKFDGSLSFSRGEGKLSVSGTLAADSLDLAQVLGPRPALLDTAGNWGAEPIVPRPNPALDLDLRISAAHVAWNGPAIDDAAGSVLQRDGRMTVKLLEASAYGGALAGELVIARAGPETRGQATLSLEDADCGALLRDWGISSYAGRCAASGEAKAVGETPAELTASADGSATFDLQSGVISGINFEEALRRSQRRAIDIARDMITGQTRFASASARVAFASGEARIAHARAEGPGAIVDAAGTIGLIARDWRVKLLATQATGLTQPATDSPRLGFALSGSWDAPTLSAAAED